MHLFIYLLHQWFHHLSHFTFHEVTSYATLLRQYFESMKAYHLLISTWILIFTMKIRNISKQKVASNMAPETPKLKDICKGYPWWRDNRGRKIVIVGLLAASTHSVVVERSNRWLRGRTTDCHCRIENVLALIDSTRWSDAGMVLQQIPVTLTAFATLCPVTAGQRFLGSGYAILKAFWDFNDFLRIFWFWNQ